MDEELGSQLKYLRLPGLIEGWHSYVEHAKNEGYSNERFLRYVIDNIFRNRQERGRLYRITCAKIPEKWVVETYPFAQQPKLRKEKVLAVYDSLKYMTDKQNILWVGPPGAGKTGLATSFLMQALERGYSGRFVVFIDLIEELHKSVADNTSQKVLKTYASYDCLQIDELGYVEADVHQVGLFFRLMQARSKRKTTLITTNLGFSDWVQFLKNEQLTSALIDRFTENCHIFNMKGCKSLRTNRSVEPTTEDQHD